MDEPLDDVIHARRFAVLRGSMECWKCGESTLVAAVWVDRVLAKEMFREGRLASLTSASATRVLSAICAQSHR
ncbi:hypothetical protein [Pseudoxanthomonas japonensis]|uniref:hypothetical protein n=1 Tax=Pseudoxanthomonas japonensis TaxID=69284 RepID=UPI001BCE3C3F|nr:hypothetical protein [Pseudoxanthomonas japonensis]